MKKVARNFTLLFVFVLAATLAGGAPKAANAAAKPKILQLSLIQPEGSSLHEGAKYWGELISKYTDGRYQVKVFGNSMLANGDMVTELEMVQSGTIHLGFSPVSILSNIAPDLGALLIPWLWKNEAVIDANLYDTSTPIYTTIEKKLHGKRLKMFTCVELGYRQLTNSVREVSKPEDLKGIKIRTTNNSMIQKVFSSLGANPTGLNFTELYTSLQNGALDGQENPLPSIIIPNKFYEVQKYFTDWKYIYESNIAICGMDFWDSLSPDDQAAFQKAATEAMLWQRDLNRSQYQNALDEIRAKGMAVTILDAAQIDVFKKAVASVVESYYARFDREFLKALLEVNQ